MAGELKVVIVDDDEWKRVGMAARLDATKEVDVVASVDHDSAALRPREQWNDIWAVVVDVYDDRAAGEIGTDLYSGINVVERVRDLPVNSLAVTPHCAHPLVRLRLQQAKPDYCYHRFQLASLDELREAVRYPDRKHRLPDLDPDDVRKLGARRMKANDLVRSFVDSPLHGKLLASSGLKELAREGVQRRTINRFRQQAVDCGYHHFDTLTGERRDEYLPDEIPRWPVIRDLMLHLLGRIDGPWSEYDKPWWLE